MEIAAAWRARSRQIERRFELEYLDQVPHTAALNENVGGTVFRFGEDGTWSPWQYELPMKLLGALGVDDDPRRHGFNARVPRPAPQTAKCSGAPSRTP